MKFCFNRDNLVCRFVNLSISFFIVFHSIRVFEYWYLLRNYDFTQNIFQLELIGILYDAAQFWFYNFFLVMFCLVIALINRTAGLFIYWLVSTIATILYIAFVLYFVENTIPLDRVFVNYSTQDILHTLAASTKFDFYLFLPFVVLLTLLGVFFHFADKRKASKFAIVFCALIWIAVFVNFGNNAPKRKNFKSNFEYYIASNKLIYFFYDIIDYSFVEKKMVGSAEINKIIEAFQRQNRHFEYVDSAYPFLRQNNDKDVIGRFFKVDTTPPNLVFVFTESLSRAFSGDSAYLGSFTPFIDSLANQSLCWNNFLSTAERTFGVIPAVLGSLPFGEKGFLDMGFDMPNHLSLVRLLKEKGYRTSFFHGGWTRFDNMDIFFNQQGIDYILDKFDNKRYSQMDTTDDGFSWGYPDKQLVQRSFEVIDSMPNTPRMDIYLTISTHHPYRFPEKDFYLKKFRNRMSELSLDQDQKDNHETMASMYASVMYMDDALRQLFEGYRSRKGFENTIFIITGDHRMPGASKSDIDNFHVPFLIYSPMLRECRKFNSVSSHNNVTPTILAFLRDNYNMNFPNQVHWIANVIDTVATFRNTQTMAFLRHNKKKNQYLANNYFLSQDQLYKISANMNLSPVDSIFLRDSLAKNLQNLILLNEYICGQNFVCPASLLHKNNNIEIIANRKIDFETDQYTGEEIIYNKNHSQTYVRSGENSVEIKQDNEFVEILKNCYLLQSYKNINTKISFAMYIKNATIDTAPMLVFQFSDVAGNQLHWQSIKATDYLANKFEIGKWITVDMSITFDSKTLLLSKNCNLQVYFWNSDRAHVFFDDLEIKLLGVLEK